MSYRAVPLVAADVSQFAKALRGALEQRETLPGHVELLNLLARAAGHRNYQSLRAAATATPRLARGADERPAAAPLTPAARKALLQFDRQGRLVRWPHKLSVQRLCMWVLWTRFEGRRVYAEREVNQLLKAMNTFGDHVTLRRELVNHRLLTRTPDCAEYRKLPARADAEARATLHAWRALMREPPAPRSRPSALRAASATPERAGGLA